MRSKRRIATMAFLCVLAGNDCKEAAPIAPPRLVAFYFRHWHAGRFGSLATFENGQLVLHQKVALQMLLAALLERNGKELPALELTGEIVSAMVSEAVPDANALRLSVARAATACRYFAGALTAEGIPLETWVEGDTGFC